MIIDVDDEEYRIFVATLAMNGLVQRDRIIGPKEAARKSVSFADAILEEINSPNKDGGEQ